MSKTAFVLTILCLVGPLTARATVIQIDLSPASGALNLGSIPYIQDHAIGLAGANESVQSGSVATGNELGTGITYDDVSNLLVFDVGYGSAFGFVDLESDWLDAHFHGPGSVNFPALNTAAPSVIVSLVGFHTASGTRSGRFTGSTTLSAAEETQLLDNLIYLNIHTSGNPAGEIRGQLVPVPEPGTALLSVAGLLMLGVAARRRNAR